jgi:uncharacterized heparinase superfamily protein
VKGIERESGWLGGRRFRLLNEEREIRGWNDESLARLWLYHLHYGEGANEELVRWWLAENPVGTGAGWEAYPISRRLVNWVVWRLAGNEGTAGMDESLALQAEYLSRRLEWHLQANHLWANAKTLVFAGCFFDGRESENWLRMGLEVARGELREQLQADGGHIERSPMYQALMAEDLLDLVNLAEIYRGRLSEDREAWVEAAGRMIGWQRRMTHPDGRVGFFHDTTLGVAGRVDELAAYGVRLGVGEQRVELGASGYRRLERGEGVVLFDGGGVGPEYQPGHSHAACLALEYSQGGQQVVSNTGISTYELGEQRMAERGTAAHNTVMVDGEDQSEVWASFRMGRRARVVEISEGPGWVEGVHDGYKRLGVMHRRRIELGERGLIVRDWLEGRGRHKVKVHWHLAPGVAGDAVELMGS